LSTNAAKRPEFLQKMMATTPRHEPEVEEAERTLKEMRGAVPTPMLDVVFRNGKARSFGYAFLKEVEFDPGDTLTLKFVGGEEIIIEGRGLGRLRQSVRLHRADEIRECADGELGIEGEESTQVECITITEGDMR